MSTKIYNGYKIPTMSVIQLRDFCMRVNNLLTPIAKELYIKIIAQTVIEIIDNSSVGLSKKDISSCPLLLALDSINERIDKIRCNNIRDPEVDFGFELCFIPTENYILTTIYSEQELMIHIWDNLTEVTPYPYWNNTDPPSGMNYDDWVKRGDEWMFAMRGSNSPGRCGLTFSIDRVQDRMLPRFDDINQFIPSFEDRVCRVAKSLLLQQHIEEHKLKGDLSYSSIIDSINSDISKLDLDKFKEIAYNKLIRNIDKDIVYGK